jgi:hypothetical protein
VAVAAEVVPLVMAVAVALVRAGILQLLLHRGFRRIPLLSALAVVGRQIALIMALMVTIHLFQRLLQQQVVALALLVVGQMVIMVVLVAAQVLIAEAILVVLVLLGKVITEVTTLPGNAVRAAAEPLRLG